MVDKITETMRETTITDNFETQVIAKLTRESSQNRAAIEVRHPDPNTCCIKVDNDEVSLIRLVVGAHVGKTDGGPALAVEGWELKRFPWWKKTVASVAAEKNQVPLIYLNTPLRRLGQDAKLPELEIREVLDPRTIVKKKMIEKSPLSPQGQVRLENQVVTALRESLQPLLLSDFQIDYEFGQYRLLPLSEEAKNSLLNDNQTYLRLVNNLQGNITNIKNALEQVI